MMVDVYGVRALVKYRKPFTEPRVVGTVNCNTQIIAGVFFVVKLVEAFYKRVMRRSVGIGNEIHLLTQFFGYFFQRKAGPQTISVGSNMTHD